MLKKKMQSQQLIKKCKCLVSQPDCRAVYLRDIQSKTRGISGYFSNYIPEEIIAAAGFHPLRIIGRYETSNHHGQSLYTPVCSFARDIFAASESDVFSFVSNVIFPNSCDSLKVLQQMWENDLTSPPVYVLLHPIQIYDHSVRYFAQQIEKLANILKHDSGLNFTDLQLVDCIQRYNHTRNLLRKLYTFADDKPHFLKGSDRIALVTAGMIMDRDEYNQILQLIVTEVFSADSVEQEAGKRIMVIGPLVDNLELLETIEQLGTSIVADDITNGSRYFDLDVDLDGNLYENLAKRYLRSGPSPTINTNIRDDEEFFRRRVTDMSLDGIIFINQKFCEPHVHSYLAKMEILKEMRVNALMLEVEHNRTTVSERDLLRVESFIEMLGEG
jgi:benzoyl-CoA reductase subunit C